MLDRSSTIFANLIINPIIEGFCRIRLFRYTTAAAAAVSSSQDDSSSSSSAINTKIRRQQPCYKRQQRTTRKTNFQKQKIATPTPAAFASAPTSSPASAPFYSSYAMKSDVYNNNVEEAKTGSHISRLILNQRKRRLMNNLANFIDGSSAEAPKRRRHSKPPKPERIKMKELIHPVDLIRKKIPGTFKMSGSHLVGYAETLNPVVFPEETKGASNIDEYLKQQEENLIIEEKKSLLHSSAFAYVNPICMEVDKQLLEFNNVDNVLSYTISHRGVFYVHNLVTAIQLIAIVSLNTTTNVIQLCSLDSDERFNLLISDLKENRKHLDLVALINILLSLQRLGIKNYSVFNAFLEPLLNMNLESKNKEDLTKAIRAAQVYKWCGYTDGLLYDKVAQVIENGRFYLNKDLLIEACRIIGSLDSHHIAFFRSGKYK